MRKVTLILHNIRSCNNVGSLLRTAEGLGVDLVYMTGYTPYPAMKSDARLPHLAAKIDKQINKTALGAQNTLTWKQNSDIHQVIDELKSKQAKVYAIEQSKNSINLSEFKSKGDVALILGREVEGIEKKVLSSCDGILEIPMFGKKESYNVSVAGAIALYHVQLLAS